VSNISYIGASIQRGRDFRKSHELVSLELYVVMCQFVFVRVVRGSWE